MGWGMGVGVGDGMGVGVLVGVAVGVLVLVELGSTSANGRLVSLQLMDVSTRAKRIKRTILLFKRKVLKDMARSIRIMVYIIIGNFETRYNL
jgi:hypothetical protein